MKKHNYTVIDADSHVYEPAEIWTKYLEPEYRTLARSSFWHEVSTDSTPVVILNGSPAPAFADGKLNRHTIYRPGMTVKEIGALDPKKSHPANPGAWDGKMRLKDMDAMDIDQAIVFPTLFAEYLPVVENPDVAYALARAYNNWALDLAKADPKRLFPMAILPMQSPAFAMKELQRTAKAGFKGVSIRPSFYHSRYPNAPEYNALWAEIERLGIAACITPSSGVTNPEWTSEGPFIERVASVLRIGQPVAEVIAPGMDGGLFLSAICFFGHMEDYPRLKLGYFHSGGYWVPLALEKSETYLWLFPQAKPVSLEPQEVFHNRPSLVNFDTWESCVSRLPDLYEDVGAWGSRYPGHDASDAVEAIANLERGGLSGDIIRKLMGENAAKFFGLKTKVPV
ncbi:MAG: amidohydrolase [Chloroflexi bacterium]|nr:amidohydrolase [Chloroflexota bacterium]